MEKLLIAAVLACLPGDRLIDWSGKLLRGLQFLDFIVTVEPFYVLHLSTWLPAKHPALLQQQTNLGDPCARGGRDDFAFGKASRR
jgi:hypothetical protein